MRLFKSFGALGAGLAIVVMALMLWPVTPVPTLPPRSGPALTSVKAWGYQLQGARPDFMAPEFDLLVIDHARNASANQLYTRGDIDEFRKRSGRPDRIVLAYMSIGEAETYRAYWKPSWLSSWPATLLKPTWLGRENKDWKGNYFVRYWQPGWQSIFVQQKASHFDALRGWLLGEGLPYIDQILEAGFDGVYLDRVDAFAEWKGQVPAAQAEMAQFVGRISAYAKARRPGFLVVAQNGEELTRRPDYVRTIDGLAKEDLMFGIDGSERENAPAEITHATAALVRLKRAGLPVFVVEYVSDVQQQVRAVRYADANGFVPSFATRDLNLAPMLPPLVAPSAPPVPQK